MPRGGRRPGAGRPKGSGKKQQRTIGDLGLSPRTHRVLRRAGITRVEDLVARDPHELLRLQGLGFVSLCEIMRKLEDAMPRGGKRPISQSTPREQMLDTIHKRVIDIIGVVEKERSGVRDGGGFFTVAMC